MRTMQHTNFRRVCDMNTAFGNPKGDPRHIDWKRVTSQCKNIASEFIELMGGLGFEATVDLKPNGSPVSIENVRDALCDIHVFAYGAHHFLGLDADADMDVVIDAVFTRFCKNKGQLAATMKHFDELGIKYYVEGIFPTICLKSAEDQMMPEYPKGKFLKAVGYSTPVFPSVTEEMSRMRQITLAENDRKYALIEQRCSDLRATLEAELFPAGA